MNAFQLLFIPLCLLTAAVIIARAARHRIPRRNGVLWAALWVAAAGFIAVPSATTAIAQAVGIARGADLVSYLSVLGGVSASLYFYSRSRRLEIMVTGVIRREALRSAERGTSAA